MSAVTVARAPVADPARARAAWLHGPLADVGLALVWVPFAVVAHLFESDTARLQWWMSLTFLVSFAHQPLTVALVYGDPAQFSLAKRIFTWSPLVFAAAVFAALHVSFTTLAIVGGLWNAEHTLMQRYGMVRIYGRKVGQDDGRLERAMLFCWLALALVWIGADTRTPGRADTLGLGSANRQGVEVLTDFQPLLAVLAAPVAIGAVGLFAAWVRAERQRYVAGTANPAKQVYVASTAVLFAVMLVDPIAGFIGYVGAHAVEYFVVVHQALGRRYPERAAGVPISAAVGRLGRTGFLALYVAIIVALVTALERAGSFTLYGVVFFTLGGLHVFYDGFIWKLRRPEVANSLSIAPATG